MPTTDHWTQRCKPLAGKPGVANIAGSKMKAQFSLKRRFTIGQFLTPETDDLASKQLPAERRFLGAPRAGATTAATAASAPASAASDAAGAAKAWSPRAELTLATR